METQGTEYGNFIEDTVRDYYRFVDAGEMDNLIALFAQDTVYRRGSLTIQGLDAFRRFYRQERIIENGSHSVTLTVAAPRVLSQGQFTGKLKNGEEVKIEFVDEFVFEGTKIIKRTTTFPGREI